MNAPMLPHSRPLDRSGAHHNGIRLEQCSKIVFHVDIECMGVRIGVVLSEGATVQNNRDLILFREIGTPNGFLMMKRDGTKNPNLSMRRSS
jgi:hypothetical protein